MTLSSRVHTVMLNGALREVFRKWRLAHQPPGPMVRGNDYFGSPSGGRLSISPILIASICMLGLVAVSSFILRRLGIARNGIVLFPFFNTFLVLVSVAINVFYSSTFGVFNSTASAEFVFLWTTFGFATVLALVYFLFSRSLM